MSRYATGIPGKTLTDSKHLFLFEKPQTYGISEKWMKWIILLTQGLIVIYSCGGEGIFLRSGEQQRTPGTSLWSCNAPNLHKWPDRTCQKNPVICFWMMWEIQKQDRIQRDLSVVFACTRKGDPQLRTTESQHLLDMKHPVRHQNRSRYRQDELTVRKTGVVSGPSRIHQNLRPSRSTDKRLEKQIPLSISSDERCLRWNEILQANWSQSWTSIALDWLEHVLRMPQIWNVSSCIIRSSWIWLETTTWRSTNFSTVFSVVNDSLSSLWRCAGAPKQLVIISREPNLSVQETGIKLASRHWSPDGSQS